MRDLAVQAANGGSQDSKAQAAAQTEFGQLQGELDRIAKSTSFGGQKLLDVGINSSTGYSGAFQVGANNVASDQLTVDLTAGAFGPPVTATAATGGTITGGAAVTATATGTISFKVDGGAAITANVTTGDTVAQTAGDINAAWQAAGNTGTIAAVAGGKITLSSQTTGTSSTVQVTAGTAQVLTDAGLTATTGTGTNGVLGTATGFDSSGLGVGAGIKVDSTTNAKAAIDYVDNAITNISTARATLGAYQNRFEHTINNLNVVVENLSSSESRIRDTDMASEMVNFTRSQILSQAGTAMLAQANQAPQGVLQLLRG